MTATRNNYGGLKVRIDVDPLNVNWLYWNFLTKSSWERIACINTDGQFNKSTRISRERIIAIVIKQVTNVNPMKSPKLMSWFPHLRKRLIISPYSISYDPSIHLPIHLVQNWNQIPFSFSLILLLTDQRSILPTQPNQPDLVQSGILTRYNKEEFSWEKDWMSKKGILSVSAERLPGRRCSTTMLESKNIPTITYYINHVFADKGISRSHTVTVRCTNLLSCWRINLVPIHPETRTTPIFPIAVKD